MGGNVKLAENAQRLAENPGLAKTDRRIRHAFGSSTNQLEAASRRVRTLSRSRFALFYAHSRQRYRPNNSASACVVRFTTASTPPRSKTWLCPSDRATHPRTRWKWLPPPETYTVGDCAHIAQVAMSKSCLHSLIGTIVRKGTTSREERRRRAANQISSPAGDGSLTRFRVPHLRQLAESLPRLSNLRRDGAHCPPPRGPFQ